MTAPTRQSSPGDSFDTRKQFGPRTSVSLLSDYDWYFSVPEMHYSNGFNSRTTISDDSAFATRTTFRINIGDSGRPSFTLRRRPPSR
jgi:hypothetical protein